MSNMKQWVVSIVVFGVMLIADRYAPSSTLLASIAPPAAYLILVAVATCYSYLFGIWLWKTWRYDKRVTELLTANTALVESRRENVRVFGEVLSALRFRVEDQTEVGLSYLKKVGNNFPFAYPRVAHEPWFDYVENSMSREDRYLVRNANQTRFAVIQYSLEWEKWVKSDGTGESPSFVPDKFRPLHNKTPEFVETALHHVLEQREASKEFDKYLAEQKA